MNQEEKLKTLETSVLSLRNNIEQLNQRKADVSIELKLLREKKFPNSDVQTFLSHLKPLKDIEREGSDLELHSATEHSELQDEVNVLEKMLQNIGENGVMDDDSLSKLNEKLNSAKNELVAKLRAILLLKQQLDDIPSQGELIQYERRLSELYALIQGKLRQTRKCYATFNALLEIKDLMLKETSILNSISSQFQDAMNSPAGRTKLIDLMEGISQGSQQKLEREKLALQAEQKLCDNLKQKYVDEISEQRRCYSLLKAFQEEYARNRQLCGQTSLP